MTQKNKAAIMHEEIIKKSLDLFVEKGYEETKISDIMKATGLSKGGMYHYFESKEHILDAVIRYALDEEMQYFDESFRKADTVTDKLILFIKAGATNPSDFRAKIAELKIKKNASIVPYLIKDLNAEYAIPYLRKIIDLGIKTGEFSTDYPDEVCELLYHYGARIFYDMQEAAPENYKEIAKHKSAAFIDSIQKLLSKDLNNDQRFEASLIAELEKTARAFHEIKTKTKGE